MLILNCPLQGNLSISVKPNKSLFLQTLKVVPNWSWYVSLKKCHLGHKQEKLMC